MKNPARYPSAIIILHWVMALAIIAMLASGLLMTDLADKTWQFQLYQWHKSLGVLVLLAVAARLGLRLLTKLPAVPDLFKPWEKLAAKAGHWALYALMVAMPLSGWAMVSASVYGLPTIVFGWFEWPHLPNLTGITGLNELAEDVHGALAWVLMALIALHIGAAIKHYWCDKTNLLRRLWWGRG